MLIILLTFAAAFTLVIAISLLVIERAHVRARLTDVVLPQSENRPGLWEKLFQKPAHASMGRLVDPLQRLVPRSDLEVSVVRKKLMRAGFRRPEHMEFFYASKLLTPLALVSLLTLTGTGDFEPFIGYSLAAVFGFLIPDYWLAHRISVRRTAVHIGLAEALDTMVVCVEAGLGLDATIQRVALELRRSQPEISEELHLVYLEQRAGSSRAEAWRNLAERTDLETIRALVAMLIQADQFGTSVATCFRVHSDSLRTQRRQKSEEEAAKTTVKLIFPLVFFIFPSLFLVVLGPSMIILMDSFSKYLTN